MKVLLVLLVIALVGQISARSIKAEASQDSPQNEELVVESSINVLKKKDQVQRPKRQFGGFGQSSSQANANAFNQYQGPGGFGASNALAGAQSFNSQGPLGGFGASAANSGSQGFNVGPNGVQGNAAFGGSQSYNLPNGHHINLAYSEGFGVNNGQGTSSNSNSLTYT